jgi:zinc protease
MTKISIAILICLLTISNMHAQQKLPDNMFFQKLPNGLDVLVVEDNSVPLATIMITVKNGAYTETPEFNGLSHLYEHMFFKANKDYSSQEAFFGEVGKLGIKFNGTTSLEKVNYFFTLPQKNLKAGLKFMNSAIRFPKFNKKEMERENVVVDAEFQRAESNPAFALTNAMDHHLWGENFSRKNVIGNHEIIESATPDLMETIQAKYYHPNNSMLSISGDVNHEEVFKMVEKMYGNWPASTFEPFEKWPVPEFKPLEKTDCFVVESNMSNVPFIEICWEGPDTRKDVNSTYAADVFSYILNQNSSKFSNALVQSGLALQVEINYLTLSHTGPITIFLVPNPDKVEECMKEVKKQLALFDSENYVTDEQIETAKRILEIHQIREQEVTSTFSEVLSFWWASASLDYFTTYNDNLKKIKRVDLQTYVRKYIKDKPYCAGLLVNPTLKNKINPQTFFKAD